MTRARDAVLTANADRSAGVPRCDTGPVGRVVFVARELASLIRELRSHASPAPGRGTDEEDQ